MTLAGFVKRAPRTDLAEWLYARWFIGAPTAAAPDVEPAGDAAFVAELSARCEGAFTWQSGFTRLSNDFVTDGHLRLYVANAREQLRGTPKNLSVRLPCAREGLMAGYFAVVSRAGVNAPDAVEHKLYVNATPAGAIELLGALLDAKSLRRTRFQAKTLNHPAHFTRRDTLLIYAEPEGTLRIARWLADFLKRHPRTVRAAIPPLVRPLVTGVGFAESPVGNESFGFHRCRLVAEGLVTARRERRDWNDCVAERFEREGLDWSRPWTTPAK
jgi:hypothetical protein